jgi:hypothetical protein
MAAREGRREIASRFMGKAREKLPMSNCVVTILSCDDKNRH